MQLSVHGCAAFGILVLLPAKYERRMSYPATAEAFASIELEGVERLEREHDGSLKTSSRLALEGAGAQ